MEMLAMLLTTLDSDTFWSITRAAFKDLHGSSCRFPIQKHSFLVNLGVDGHLELNEIYNSVFNFKDKGLKVWDFCFVVVFTVLFFFLFFFFFFLSFFYSLTSSNRTERILSANYSQGCFILVVVSETQKKRENLN